MSSIIDALKKSDNSRANETGANINQIKFGDQSPPKSRSGFWKLVVLLLIIAAGVYAWTQEWHLHAMDWFGSDVAVVNSQISDVKAETPTASKADTTAPPSNKLLPPKTAEVKAKTEAAIIAAETVKATSTDDEQQVLQVTADNSPTTELKIAQDNDDQDQIIEEIQTTKQATDEDDPVQADDMDSKLTVVDSPKKRRQLEPRLTQDYLLLHQVNFEVRKNIPVIKLNIHIYDPDPENRMVILNGVKFTAGELVEESVLVKEINQQGVVLEYEGVRFLIPK